MIRSLRVASELLITCDHACDMKEFRKFDQKGDNDTWDVSSHLVSLAGTYHGK